MVEGAANHIDAEIFTHGAIPLAWIVRLPGTPGSSETDLSVRSTTFCIHQDKVTIE
jgi:hypothetical protein